MKAPALRTEDRGLRTDFGFRTSALIAQHLVLCFALCAALFALCVSAEAQQPKKLPRLGYLAGDPTTRTREAFRQGLRDFGYVEGKSILIEWRFAEDKLERIPELAAELVGLKLDVIVAGNGPAVKALKQTTTTIPIVIAYYGGDPVADGIVASFAKPGGNITGAIPLASELSGKRLELLKETLPKLSRVAVMWNPDVPPTRSQWQETQSAARALGAQALSLEIRKGGDIEKAIEAAKHERVDALIVLSDPLSYLLRKRIVTLAEKVRLPGMYPIDDFVEAGGLMSYSPNNETQYRRAAYYVDKILKGAKPADLPIEQPAKFEFAINLKTAKQIGLTIPANVLARADRVIR
jgi:putative ABC transport system substrate-binding protein